MIYIESHCDLETINDAIGHQTNFHGCRTVDNYGDTDDMLIINYLINKKKELENIRINSNIMRLF